jgi:hypothetical protein
MHEAAAGCSDQPPGARQIPPREGFIIVGATGMAGLTNPQEQSGFLYPRLF